MKAYVLVTTQPGTAEDVAKVIRNLGGVISAECVYGRFDLVVILESPELKAIDHKVHQIQRISNVLRTETALTHYLYELENEYREEQLKAKRIIE